MIKTTSGVIPGPTQWTGAHPPAVINIIMVTSDVKARRDGPPGEIVWTGELRPSTSLTSQHGNTQKLIQLTRMAPFLFQRTD